MANHSIKVKGVADFSDITREVHALQKDVSQAFGKDGKKVLDDKSIELFSKEVQDSYVKMTTQLQKLKKEAKEIGVEIKKSLADEKKSEELARKKAENLRKQIIAEKSLKDLRKSEKTIQTGIPAEQAAKIISMDEKRKQKEAKDKERQEQREDRAAGRKRSAFTGVVGNGLSKVGGELPGVSQIAGVGEAGLSAGQAASSAGLGMGAIAGLAALGLAAGVAALAVSRMAAGFEAFKQILPSVVSLAGMGVTPVAGRGNRAIQMGEAFGFNEPEMLNMQKGASKAFGKTTQRGGENRLMNMMGFSRMLGMEPGEITAGGDELRKAGGTEMAQKQIGQILEKAITSGMDKTQSSAYLASAVNLLSNLNSSGVLNASQLLSVMTDLVTKGNMSPEQVARSLGGINAAIAGSSGESNAFFQTAAARGGMGGGTLLGSQFATRQGLAGVDMDALNKQIGDTDAGRMGIKSVGEMGLGDKDFTQKFAANIMKEINSRFDQTSKEGRSATLGFAGQVFGVKTAPEAAKALALLEKIAKGKGTEADDKLFRELNQDPEENWRDHVLEELKSVDNNAGLIKTVLDTMATEAASKNQQIDLGEAIAPTFNRLTSVMTELDATLTRLTNAMEHSTLKDMGSAIADMVDNLMTALGNGMSNLVTKMMTPDFWMPSTSMSGAAPTSLSQVNSQFAGENGKIASSFFGTPKPADKASELPPTKSAAETGMAEHTNAIVSAIHSQTKELKKVPGSAPKVNRDSSRP